MNEPRPVWYPGDRVEVVLPDNLGTYGRKHRDWTFAGTVVSTDDRGVSVQLDRPVNGVNTCHATYYELKRIAS